MTKIELINKLLKWAELNGAQISPDVEFKEISKNYIGAIYKGNKVPDSPFCLSVSHQN